MLTTIDDVIYEANIINIADEEVIGVHLDTASMIVMRLISAEFYNLLESERSEGTTRYNEVKKAETNYAVSFMLMSLNIISTGNGIVTRFDSSKSGEYNMKPEQVNLMINNYKALADKFIAPYLIGGELNPFNSSYQQAAYQVSNQISRITSV